MDGRQKPWWYMPDTTGAGGTLRDDELIMAIIEAAVAWYDSGCDYESCVELVLAVEAYKKEQG
jgi:hypothetical protein